MKLIDQILKEVNDVVSNVNEKEVYEVVNIIDKSNSILLMAKGEVAFRQKVLL